MPTSPPSAQPGPARAPAPRAAPAHRPAGDATGGAVTHPSRAVDPRPASRSAAVPPRPMNPPGMLALRRLWHYRGFVAGMVRREFRARYLNSLLGATWAVLNPLAMIVIY